MPDIAMCASERCPISDSCYRSPRSGTVSSEGRQAWHVLGDPDGPSEDFLCKFYIGSNLLALQERIRNNVRGS